MLQLKWSLLNTEMTEDKTNMGTLGEWCWCEDIIQPTRGHISCSGVVASIQYLYSILSVYSADKHDPLSSLPGVAWLPVCAGCWACQRWECRPEPVDIAEIVDIVDIVQFLDIIHKYCRYDIYTTCSMMLTPTTPPGCSWAWLRLE